MFNTPILLIVWRRPELFKKQIDILRSINAQRIFVAIDGERDGIQYDQERKRIQETKLLVRKINWGCELNILFQEKNLGCGKAPANAISWFFQHVEEGIVLEDDIIPELEFFRFMELNLKKYRDSNYVISINGYNRNLFLSKLNVDISYSSPIFIPWGWATYARYWRSFKYEIQNLAEFNRYIDDQILTSEEKKNWKEKLNWCVNNLDEIQVWDYQWQFCIWKLKGKCVTPNFSLVKNEGFSESGWGTHTVSEKWPRLNKLESIIKRSDFIFNVLPFQRVIQRILGMKFSIWSRYILRNRE